MHQMFNARKTAVAAAASLAGLLAGCGGSESPTVTVAASAVQPTLTARAKSLIAVDGMQFKDLNANGKLDPYEDWRLTIDERINDLARAR
jgi:beta-glucosidase